ncbi:hypothetical protein Psed_5815 [Pseudonocardia dioxanivorans CB1190]|uniref:Holin n=1 Tax=Pseudonocardia dioxanivorans (strain ATCC 55486 / DSM 44775 / JCM 13855 / CB1190) TaxID=675635 RepID=F4D1F2_PSEUX|nr:hypothetical protein [Pseudonocardia dioxanivorans]AEA27940.1 hypothetical protein Psed_5815 [Pseudonocardia dioxanivorans CB1190]
MPDHALTDDELAPTVAVDKTVEVKVVVSALVTLVAGVALSLLNALQTDSSILGGLPPWLQFVLITAIPPLATFAAGYAQPSNRV